MSREPHDIGHMSLIGNRTINQDRCLSLQTDNGILLGVADGMGGHPKGERAAQILVDVCELYFGRRSSDIPNPNLFLKQLLIKAHQEILNFGNEQRPSINPRTTAAMALILDQTAYWAHLGDSRLYLFRNGDLIQRTIDHSYVENLRRHGIISSEETKSHPQRNYVTRCLGGLPGDPDVSFEAIQLETGDIQMLCSDGLWGPIDEELMGEAFSSDMSMTEATEALANEAALKAFPESDNVTILAFRMGDPEPGTPEAQLYTQQNKKEAVSQAVTNLQAAILNFETDKIKDKP